MVYKRAIDDTVVMPLASALTIESGPCTVSIKAFDCMPLLLLLRLLLALRLWMRPASCAV
jgi:hypothetical protein